jgi:XRE family transcriptional regulator, regulator of sulfur utilization
MTAPRHLPSPRVDGGASDAVPSIASERSGSLHRRVGRALQGARLGRRLTQGQVAELADLSLKYVGEIERGEANATLDTLEAIANVVGLDSAEIMAGLRESITERIRVLLRDDAKRVVARLQEHLEWLETIDPARQLVAEQAIKTPRVTVRRRAAVRREAKKSATPTRRGGA